MVMEFTRSGYGGVDELSKRFGFQGAADMRTKLKRRTGLTVQRARTTGGLAELFLRRVAAERTAVLPHQCPVHVEHEPERSALRELEL